MGGLAPGQRWSVGRKREVVLRLLRGESADDLSRELGVPLYRLEGWRERALSGIDGSLREREGDPLSEELSAAMKRIGELTMENSELRESRGGLIGIGGSFAAPPLPHHRAYGSVHGGSRSCANTIGTRMAGRAI